MHCGSPDRGTHGHQRDRLRAVSLFSAPATLHREAAPVLSMCRDARAAGKPALLPCVGRVTLLPAEAHRLLYRKREPLFGQAPFDKPHLKVAEIGFQKFLIAVDVAFEGMQTSFSFTHDATYSLSSRGQVREKIRRRARNIPSRRRLLLSPLIPSGVGFSRLYTQQM